MQSPLLKSIFNMNLKNEFNKAYQEFRAFEECVRDPDGFFDTCHACPYKNENGRRVFILDGNFRMNRFARASKITHDALGPKLIDGTYIGMELLFII
jgi:hypothetical protein